MERVTWRSKQSLDFSFLMMWVSSNSILLWIVGFSFLDSIRITARYAKSRGTFYVQLEDDVLTKKGFISIMKHFALEKIADKQSWSDDTFARIPNLFLKALHQQILKKWNFSLQVCYWLLSTGFHWKDVQICGTSLARSVLPHVLQR